MKVLGEKRSLPKLLPYQLSVDEFCSAVSGAPTLPLEKSMGDRIKTIYCLCDHCLMAIHHCDAPQCQWAMRKS